VLHVYQSYPLLNTVSRHLMIVSSVCVACLSELSSSEHCVQISYSMIVSSVCVAYLSELSSSEHCVQISFDSIFCVCCMSIRAILFWTLCPDILQYNSIFCVCCISIRAILFWTLCPDILWEYLLCVLHVYQSYTLLNTVSRHLMMVSSVCVACLSELSSSEHCVHTSYDGIFCVCCMSI